ncbi:MAG: helix-turn-helix domain-containing protein [Myxococcota bacterium]
MIQVVHRDPEVAALFVAALRRLGHLAPPPVYDAGAAIVAFRNRQCPCGLIAETLIDPGDGIQLAGIVRSMWSAEIVMIGDVIPLVGEGATVAGPDVQAVADALPRNLTMNAVDSATPAVGLSPSSLRRIVNHVESNISGCLSLEALSAEVSMSPDRFGRLFREALGDTPHQFIIRRRMMKAIHLLQRTSLSVTQIAVECGYRGASNFVQAFKRFAGETPGAMRNRLRGRPLAVEAFVCGPKHSQPSAAVTSEPAPMPEPAERPSLTSMPSESPMPAEHPSLTSMPSESPMPAERPSLTSTPSESPMPADRSSLSSMPAEQPSPSTSSERPSSTPAASGAPAAAASSTSLATGPLAQSVLSRSPNPPTSPLYGYS